MMEGNLKIQLKIPEINRAVLIQGEVKVMQLLIHQNFNVPNRS